MCRVNDCPTASMVVLDTMQTKSVYYGQRGGIQQSVIVMEGVWLGQRRKKERKFGIVQEGCSRKHIWREFSAKQCTGKERPAAV